MLVEFTRQSRNLICLMVVNVSKSNECSRSSTVGDLYGCSQVPGLDFNDSIAPVVNDVKF
jgi:hypothetical protein